MKAMGKGSLSSLLTVLLNLGWYGVAVLLVLAVCLLLISPWVHPPNVEFAVPVAFTMDADTHRLTASSPGLENVHIQDGRGSLRFSPRSRSVVAAGATMLIAWLALILWIVGQLRDVVRTLRDGQPFVAPNAARIRRIGWAIILGEFARWAFTYFGTSYAMTRFTIEGLRLHTQADASILPILYGSIILVIAEVFRIGTRLDEEQSLTV